MTGQIQHFKTLECNWKVAALTPNKIGIMFITSCQPRIRLWISDLQSKRCSFQRTLLWVKHSPQSNQAAMSPEGSVQLLWTLSPAVWASICISWIYHTASEMARQNTHILMRQLWSSKNLRRDTSLVFTHFGSTPFKCCCTRSRHITEGLLHKL